MSKIEELIKKKERIKKKVKYLEKQRQEEKELEEAWHAHESVRVELTETEFQIWTGKLKEVEEELKKLKKKKG